MTKLIVAFRNFINTTKNGEKTIPSDKEEDSIRLSVSEGLLSGAKVLQTGGHLRVGAACWSQLIYVIWARDILSDKRQL